ncbi:MULTISPECIES: ABC transporter permease [Rhodobacterales]|uniref:ABC transporter permease n=1 Tax=Rhodobacterales TaxID=204455 RepID=UPI001C95E0D4|nr:MULTISPECIES: iron chelate uptake ABC transporter family permease subunit [Rhodobacterales]MBY6092447.1 iron chelate uptake ABC transporter family permease subunit [Maritimibacter alkaliphilus]MCA0921393.1 iron chelate uptake ABC transporter family permease subunit [Pseudooceanicola nanhaiensis]
MRRLTLLLGLALVAVLALLSLFIGAIPLDPRTLFSDPEAARLILISRLPRTLAAILSGGALAVTGQVMQILARNRFIEPVTAGAGQSAALGILLVTLFLPGAPIWAKMAIASLTTLVGSIGLLALIRPLPPTQPLLVPLVALVYGGIIGAVVTFVAYQGDMTQFIGTWLSGELSGVLRGRYEMLWIAGLAAAATWIIADRITLLGLGASTARSLGVNVARITALGVAAISVVTAMTVVTVGAIPFIGLVIPNLTARLLGDNLRRTLPVSALFGAALVLAADILGRVIRMPFEVPVSATVGVVGAALFLYLLYREPRHAA